LEGLWQQRCRPPPASSTEAPRAVTPVPPAARGSSPTPATKSRAASRQTPQGPTPEPSLQILPTAVQGGGSLTQSQRRPTPERRGRGA
jgi:hypothetical protein